MEKICILMIGALFYASACTPIKQTEALSPGKKTDPTSKLRVADLLFLTPDKQLEMYKNAEVYVNTNRIPSGSYEYPLANMEALPSGFTFMYKDTSRTFEDFMHQTHAVGVMLIRNDTILLEEYRGGNNMQSKWINFSVAKSVTSLLFGAALADGYIRSLDDKVTRYIPQLARSEYDHVSLKDLLQMSSGVRWNDDPRDKQSDLLKVSALETKYGLDSVFAYLSRLDRAAPPGTKFNYNTIETSLAGIIIRNVTGRTLSEYLSDKIWKPFGMHEDANWALSPSTGSEIGGCCISATLRDYALLGMFALRNGQNKNGRELLPASWIKESTMSAASYPGYGYYWWLRPGGEYFASGSFGQQIEIIPSKNMVIARKYLRIGYAE